jgi:peptidoglycan hydrolase-like protein with peptidoglycan-binding domain
MQAESHVKQLTLQLGSTGDAVKELQKILKDVVGDVSLEIDGIFGETTELAVKVFQYRVFLNDDGIVGPKTWQALYAGQRSDLPVLRLGSKGDDVTKVQKVLKFSQEAKDYFNSNGYYFGEIDGNFGAKTEVAVKAFQKDKKIPVDGVIGQQTWTELMSLATEISHISL